MFHHALQMVAQRGQGCGTGRDMGMVSEPLKHNKTIDAKFAATASERLRSSRSSRSPFPAGLDSWTAKLWLLLFFPHRPLAPCRRFFGVRQRA